MQVEAPLKAPHGPSSWGSDTTPDYVEAFRWRVGKFDALLSSKAMRAGAFEYYRDKPHEFIEHWCVTYDPRNAGTDVPTTMPFIMFQRQHELIDFLLACLRAEQHGLVEKTRDMGATWVCCAFSVWLWLYWDGSAVGWGSLKAADVDELGVATSVFEKMRIIIRNLPPAFHPIGFDATRHMPHLRIMNPQTGAVIQGASGDNIGRGGRSLAYFKDESAHYERPEKIEAALGDNTRVQIDISSVNGVGNVFHRFRESGTDWKGGDAVPGTNVFVMDWRDHPHKTQAWYDAREAKYKAAGLLHVHRQEIDRAYAASVAGVCIPSEWVRSCIDAHLKLPHLDFEEGGWMASLDVADSEKKQADRNAFGKRKGVMLKYAEEWAELDTGATTRRMVVGCEGHPDIEVQYDCIGVGSGVKAEANRLIEDDLMPDTVHMVPWDAGAGPRNPDDHVIPGDKQSPLNKDFYANLKAQGWWQLRLRCERTHRMVQEEPGVEYDVEDLISLPSDLPDIYQIEKELSQPTIGRSTRLKMLINKTPEGTRSPNFGDMIMQLYWPVEGAIPYHLWV